MQLNGRVCAPARVCSHEGAHVRVRSKPPRAVEAAAHAYARATLRGTAVRVRTLAAVRPMCTHVCAGALVSIRASADMCVQAH
eukprot:6206470-Pleurochrysis_carterae.AAC.3